MKTLTNQLSRLVVLATISLTFCATGRAQTATWTGANSTTDWNDNLNWDVGTPQEGTNAIIGAGAVVDYNTPMTAPSFAGVDNSGTLTVGAAGFNIDAAGLAAYTGNAASLLSINAGGIVVANNSGTIALATGSEIAVEGGVLVITNSTGNITFGVNGNNAGAGFTNNGGTVVFSQPFQSRGRFTRFAMHGGTLDLLGGGGIFETSNDQERQFLINGGTANLGDFTIARTLNGVSAAGLVVSNGVVNVTSLRVGVANAAAGTTIAGGVLTNTGAFTICDRNNGATTSNRRIHFYIRGGSVYSTDPAGIIVANQSNSGAAAASVIGGNLDINAGLLVAEGITLVKDNTLVNAHGTLTLAGSGTIYLGSVGLVGNVGVSGTTYTVNLNGGTLGAKTDYTIAANATLANTVTIKAADAADAPFNITNANVWSGTGALLKTGGGVLTLNSNNTYSGITTVAAGTLALGADGSISNTPQILLGGGATFDVSALGSFDLAAGRTLGGDGTVVGNLTAQNGSTIRPGSSAGTLTFSGALTQAGGVVNSFELSATTNDLIDVIGNLDVTAGTNIIQVSALGGSIPAGTYILFQYGSLNGGVTNFTVSGAPGFLTNDTVAKTISLVTTGVRAATSITWLGSPLASDDWDVLISTNWLNGGVPDFFVQGDDVRFDDTGLANPLVNLVDVVNPGSTTVDATGNYTISGSGRLGGNGGLAKTNTGTLTVLTTNSYVGPTVITGGAVETTTLANGGANSGIGGALASAANLVLDGGTLRYLGGSVGTDRGATLNADGGTIDVATNSTTLTANGSLTGDGALIKAGPGTLLLAVANSHTNGTVINEGTLQLNHAAAAGTGGLTNNASTLRINGALVVDNPVNFSGVTTVELTGVGAGNVALRGSWSGDGTVQVNFLTQNALQTFTVGGLGGGNGHLWDFSGTVDFGTNTGFLRFNNSSTSVNFGSSNATFNLGTGDGLLSQRNGGTTTHLGALLGGPNTRLSGRRGDVAGICTYSIGGKNLDTTFEGIITNGINQAAIIKVGTGRLTLTGESPYSGTTTVESGTLHVDGNITASPVTVIGGTLSGNGTLGGTVDVQANGTLSPGSSIGQLTINNSLNLQFGSTNFMELDKAAGTNDSVVGLASVFYGGALVITNLAGTLSAGDSFKLFDATPGNYFGAFDPIIPATPGAGLSWDTSGLTVDGTLKVVGAGPAISSIVLAGGDVILSGSGGPALKDYQILTSTNVALPLADWTTNATDLFDGAGNFSFTNAISPGTPRQFYILQFQLP